MEPSQDAADPAEEGRPTPKGGVLQLHSDGVDRRVIDLVDGFGVAIVDARVSPWRITRE